MKTKAWRQRVWVRWAVVVAVGALMWSMITARTMTDVVVYFALALVLTLAGVANESLGDDTTVVR